MRPSLGAGFFYAIAGVALMLAGVVAPDVFHLTPRLKELVFFGCMAAAFVCLIAGAIKEARGEAKKTAKTGHMRRMIAIYGMLISGLAFLGFATAYFWPSTANDGQEESKTQAAIEIPTAYFECNFLSWEAAEANPGPTTEIQVHQFNLPTPIVSISGNPGGVIHENHRLPTASAYPFKCDVTFYNKEPIFNIVLPLTIELYEVLSNGQNGIKNGGLSHSLSTDIMFKQSPTQGTKFSFFVSSFDAYYFLRVAPSNIFRFQDNNGVHEGKIILSDVMGIEMISPKFPPANVSDVGKSH